MINGKKVLLCRQVDDTAVACADPAICKMIIEVLATKIFLTDDGLMKSFNGVDVEQTRDYVRISCESCIRKMLVSHGWDKSGPNESATRNLEPLPDAIAKVVDTTAEQKKEALELVDQHQFSYQSELGESIYAYVAGRIDIGYAITKLARHAQCPTAENYESLKKVCKYLRKTANWGIIYWRPKPLMHLAMGKVTPLAIPETSQSLAPFPLPEDPLTLVGYVDAAYWTDSKTRRSVTGTVFTLCGAAIAFRSKLQAIVATSSTEAEFIATVQAAKTAKYHLSVLSEVGFPQNGPTKLYEDNEAAILMTNAGKSTQRSRHIDIQHFA